MQANVSQCVRDLRKGRDGNKRNERTGNRRAHSTEKRGRAACRVVGENREWSGHMGEDGINRSFAIYRTQEEAAVVNFYFFLEGGRLD